MVLGEVIASRNPALAEGTLVRALAGWATHSILAADALGLERVDPAPGVPMEAYMGALGPSGLTAWVGLHVIGQLRADDTVLVSAAAGAVGSVVCQLARIAGARVVGIASGPQKCAQLAELGVAATIDRRASHDLAAAVRAAAPDGIDVFFDNVGGATLECVLPLMREQGRVVICGMIGDYNDQDHPYPCAPSGRSSSSG
jgi:NADPH-dependent curcumin reductase CurA